MPRYIILVRHGQTQANVQKVIQGQRDTLLSTEGSSQAQKLAYHLKHQRVDAILSSDLQRAYQTAKAIGEVLKLPVSRLRLLRERYFGPFENQVWDDIQRAYPNFIDQAYCQPENDLGVESNNEVDWRIQKTLAYLSRKHRDQTVLLVTHGGFIRRTLGLITYLSSEAIDHIPNTSYTLLSKTDSGYRLDLLAQAPHLS